MGKYNALAVAGEFDVRRMSEGIERLVYNVFSYDPVIGKPGHWLRDKQLCLPIGIRKEDYVRLTDRCICEWEWSGVDAFDNTDGKLRLRNISQTKSSEMSLRALVRLLGRYNLQDGEVFAILGTNQGDEGLNLEIFWTIDGQVESMHVGADDSFIFNPFLQEHLWFNAREMPCLSST